MKLYVINLARSQERFKRLEAIFAALSLNFTHIDAVDNIRLDEKTRAKINAINVWPQPMTRGEIACFLSHKKVLEQLIADEVTYGVIFEDDVELADAASVLLSSTAWLPEGVDIVKLETAGKKLWLGCPQPLMIEGKAVDKFHLAHIKSTHIMTAAYLISRAAAIRLVDIMDRKSAPFDHLLFDFSLGVVQEFNLLQLDPAIAIQADLGSTLEGERATTYQRIKKRPLVQTLKREIKRVFYRAYVGLWGMKVNYFSREQWKRVPFCGKNG